MISSGIFVLPGLAFARSGPAVIFAYLGAGLLAGCGMLSIAELSTAMPKAGGDYFFVARGLGPAAGTISGLLSWFSLSLKSAFALAGMGALGAAVLPLESRLVALGFCALFLLVNLAGVRSAGWLQLAVVAGLLALLGLFVVLLMPAVRVARFEPFAPKGWPAVLTTAGFVFVSYGGLLKVASVAEEVRRPARTIPLGMVASLLVVTFAYVLVVFVTVGVLDVDTLAGSLTPLSDAARRILGGPGAVALGVGAVLAFVSTANAGMMAASRYLLALGRDGLFPSGFARVNRRRGTPHFALIATAALMAGALFLDLDLLVKAASTVLILSYMLSTLSVVIMRESRLQNYRPKFRAPLYPWLQIVAVLGFGFLLFEMGGAALLVSAGLVVAAFLVYWFYGRGRTYGESALLHILQRLTARELVTRSLESELKDIIRERDDIVMDRFDRLVENSVVLDLQSATDYRLFFSKVADELAPRLGADREVLHWSLLEREAETTTALTPWLAIPHVVIEGEGRFGILIARCREGIRFSDAAPSVQSVFVIAGTRDERTFHLQALAAIAQIAHEPGFEQRWNAARDAEALRDLVLLGRRRRQ
ncbi:MAG: amino acid permease [candidate division WOR-3 bacterium]|nr:MAG: amino acid permease [candidate division WOR-3 bacterium]